MRHADLGAYRIARLDGRGRFNGPHAVRPHARVEEVQGLVAGHRPVAQRFERVPQFMTDRAHEVRVGFPRVEVHPQHAGRAGHRHGDEAGPDAVPAPALLDVDDAVAGVDGLDQATEGLGPLARIEASRDVRALVMELVESEDLSRGYGGFSG